MKYDCEYFCIVKARDAKKENLKEIIDAVIFFIGIAVVCCIFAALSICL